jgi:uncharacterized alpha-E superfamily protein
MLSRAANSVYWMARYLERADNVARFIDVNAHLILDLGQSADQAQWHPLIVTSDDEKEFAARYPDSSEAHVIRFLTFDEANPNSLLSCINAARENARTVREIIPSDMWEKMNELYHQVQAHSRSNSVRDLQQLYAQVRSANYWFAGLLQNVVSHGEAWHFLRLGRMIERADKTARLIDVKYFYLLPSPDAVGSASDSVQWGAVLKSVNAFEMYRKQFHRIVYQDVAEFLIFDPLFPRSMAYCVASCAKSLIKITRRTTDAGREIAALQAVLEATDTTTILKNGLHEFIDQFQIRLNVFDRAIHRSFFGQTIS